MDSLGKALHESFDEIYRKTGIKFSDEPDAKGRYVIENFDGSIEELAERLDCVTVEDAFKRLNELSERHNNNLIVENRRYFNELTSQKEEYTIEEAKEISKKVLKNFTTQLKK